MPAKIPRSADAELDTVIGAAAEAEFGIRLAPATLAADEMDRLDDAERHHRSAEWAWRT